MTEKDFASMTDEELARIGLKRYDPVDYLNTDEDITEYLNQVLADGDAGELARALGYIARAKGMTKVAKETGLAREALYRSLAATGNPRFDTIQRVARALGIRFVATMEPTAGAAAT